MNIARFQRQVCFVITKIDSVPSISEKDKTRDDILHRLSTNLMKRMESEFKVETNLEDTNPLSSTSFYFYVYTKYTSKGIPALSRRILS